MPDVTPKTESGRALHVRTPEGPDDYCTGCGELWPCNFEQGWSEAASKAVAEGIDACIAIVEQSLSTVRAEYEDNPESRVIPTSIAAREGILTLLRGYRALIASERPSEKETGR